MNLPNTKSKYYRNRPSPIVIPKNSDLIYNLYPPPPPPRIKKRIFIPFFNIRLPFIKIRI